MVTIMIKHFVLLVSALISLAQAQSIFIDNVPGYTQLASCAEQPLSIIIRSMASGCGDSQHTTSYACFCSSSSSKFSSIISREVIKTCSGSDGDASSALGVFSSYCQIGVAAAPTIPSNSAGTSTPVPANTASTTATSTAGPTSPAASSIPSTGLSAASKIVIGVVVPVGVILIVIAMVLAVFTIRSHRRHSIAGAENTTENGLGPKNISTDGSSNRWSDRSRSPTINTKFPFEVETPLTEKLEIPPVELPTDGRYGNGTAAHELQE